jgi:hypothetical protein
MKRRCRRRSRGKKVKRMLKNKTRRRRYRPGPACPAAF